MPLNATFLIIDPFTKAVLATYSLGELRFISRDAEQLLAWSPNGEEIAFSAVSEYRSQYVSSIFILNLDSGHIRRVTSFDEQADSPVWSPSGQQILYRSRQPLRPPLPDEGPWLEMSNFHVIDVNGGGKFYLTQREQTNPILACPQWLTNNIRRGSENN